MTGAGEGGDGAAALDPRIHPFRPDLAAAWLEGAVEAERFAEGEAAAVAAEVLPLRAAPDERAERSSELLFGEAFTVYGRDGGWAWGQCAADGYVGYVAEDGLGPPVGEPTHSVSAPRAIAFSEPDHKSPPAATLHMTGPARAAGEEAGYILVEGAGWTPDCHLAPVGAYTRDIVGTARLFVGTPYLWGGRSGLGMDCSGFAQVVLARTGRAAPRDSDQQERSVGRPAPGGLRRARPGDLMFLPGHVAVVSTRGRIVHASAFHMAVVEEPLDGFLRRVAEIGAEVTSVRRP